MCEVHYRRATSVKTKRGFESGRFGALKLGKLCKANKCSDTVGMGVSMCHLPMQYDRWALFSDAQSWFDVTLEC